MHDRFAICGYANRLEGGGTAGPASLHRLSRSIIRYPISKVRLEERVPVAELGKSGDSERRFGTPFEFHRQFDAQLLK